MRSFAVLAAALLAAGLAMSPPARAQSTGVAPPAETERPAPRSARPRREPTPGQLAARERQKKCGLEWREAKAKGTTGGLKWPQYWSACNKRMKGTSV